jgi:hypothetical protein
MSTSEPLPVVKNFDNMYDFIEHFSNFHEPVLKIGKMMCAPMSCENCKIKRDCYANANILHPMTKNSIKEVKRIHPELFL